MKKYTQKSTTTKHKTKQKQGRKPMCEEIHRKKNKINCESTDFPQGEKYLQLFF